MKLIDDILWWLYPTRCAACRKVIKRDERLCGECDKKLERIKDNCLKCGAERKRCICKNYFYAFAGCIAPFSADDTAKSCVYNYKIGGNLQIADFLFENMYSSYERYYKDISFDAVTAVPMSFSKLNRVGYNHSEILSKRLADKIGVEYRELLFKKRSHIQHSLSRRERFEKIKGVFCAGGRYNMENVLLIDDIKTTGATLNECARQLRFAGVKNVYCLTATVSGKRLDGEKQK